MTKYLTVDEILTLHSIIKEQFHENTTSGKIDRNKIQSIIDKPKREIAGQEIYTTIYEKAACLLEEIDNWVFFDNTETQTHKTV